MCFSFCSRELDGDLHGRVIRKKDGTRCVSLSLSALFVYPVRVFTCHCVGVGGCLEGGGQASGRLVNFSPDGQGW